MKHLSVPLTAVACLAGIIGILYVLQPSDMIGFGITAVGSVVTVCALVAAQPRSEHPEKPSQPDDASDLPHGTRIGLG